MSTQECTKSMKFNFIYNSLEPCVSFYIINSSVIIHYPIGTKYVMAETVVFPSIAIARNNHLTWKIRKRCKSEENSVRLEPFDIHSSPVYLLKLTGRKSSSKSSCSIRLQITSRFQNVDSFAQEHRLPVYMKKSRIDACQWGYTRLHNINKMHARQSTKMCRRLHGNN